MCLSEEAVNNKMQELYALMYTLKMLGCFNPTLDLIWTNPNVGLKNELKNVTQWLGLSIFDPKLG